MQEDYTIEQVAKPVKRNIYSDIFDEIFKTLGDIEDKIDFISINQSNSGSVNITSGRINRTSLELQLKTLLERLQEIKSNIFIGTPEGEQEIDPRR